MNTVTLPLELKKSPLHAVEKVTLKTIGPKMTKIALPTLDGIQIEKLENILYLEADGNYTKIHFVNSKSILVSKTLHAIELMLEDSHQFVRIHRSYNINIEKLTKYVRGKGGFVIMENGKELDVSHNKKQNLMDAIKTLFRYE
jgi:two-component system, LytTR family, response regulator